ncbi:MAG: [FeFe] hydrogenase H-cluster maturation GTPase HydF [Spirochaetes bacterium]|nr:[FeFe] hydrogenase H-cluster maturation GTPase HydF [Spirochaetota bacterium]HQQ19022.1 [FeFe] hydrogenase H-cluster maturation GTPase HydF [Exilispira sp.]
MKTPTSERLKIVVIGLRNSGKSFLINNIAEKNVAIVSDLAGTTTDPVAHTMELSDLGPVVFYDTAGLDDIGEIGKLRVEKSREKLDLADIVVFVTNSNKNIIELEKNYIEYILKNNKLLIIAFTFYQEEIAEDKKYLTSFPYVVVDNTSKKGILELKKKLIDFKDKVEQEAGPVEGIVFQNQLILLVTPIDISAPKRRLILPQVETLRDILDKDASALVVKETQLEKLYKSIGREPDLVITDSQVFHIVAKILPQKQPLTSFSILMARKKGELLPFIESIPKFFQIKDGSHILILELCNHHRQDGDIGTVKIPALFRKFINANVKISITREFPGSFEIKDISAVIMCGGCMITRKQYTQNMKILMEHNIPILNYGIFLALVNNLLPRAIEVFPEIYEKFDYSFFKSCNLTNA